ncbi:MAG: type III pantothenate kinase [Betaproteobacteria bacterium]|nr:type III pantothenate kinase [Betaproteobacteria bacterium]
MGERRLLLDAGNTSLKWAVVENGSWRTSGRSDYAEWTALAAHLKAGTDCFIASVASAGHEQRIARLLERAGITPTWLAAEPGFGDVKNAYLDPAQLGVDRWMALIAARKHTREAVLVVSAGTAMTVDALSAAGEFLGGVIVPGVRLMRESLQAGTARIDGASGDWQAFPRTTADAVQSGIIAALCGAVEQQHARLAAREGTPPRCLVTGGDAQTLLPYLNVTASHVPALVLEGIDCVARGAISR